MGQVSCPDLCYCQRIVTHDNHGSKDDFLWSQGTSLPILRFRPLHSLGPYRTVRTFVLPIVPMIPEGTKSDCFLFFFKNFSSFLFIFSFFYMIPVQFSVLGWTSPWVISTLVKLLFFLLLTLSRFMLFMFVDTIKFFQESVKLSKTFNCLLFSFLNCKKDGKKKLDIKSLRFVNG